MVLVYWAKTIGQYAVVRRADGVGITGYVHINNIRYYGVSRFGSLYQCPEWAMQSKMPEGV